MFEDLRSMVLGADPAAFNLAPTPELPRVWATLMEMGWDNVTVSLVVIAEGSTSLYFSSGGGIIGGGQHEAVRRASQEFLETIDRQLDHMTSTVELPLPSRRRVRFNVLGFSGRWTAEAPEDDLANGRHPLSTAFHAGQAVITELRLMEERGQPGAPPSGADSG